MLLVEYHTLQYAVRRNITHLRQAGKCMHQPQDINIADSCSIYVQNVLHMYIT